MSAPISNVSRRSFLKASGIGASSLVLGGVIPTFTPVWATPPAESSALNLFVSINTDNSVNIVCHRSEMGQGIRTGLAQVVAEELCVAWDKVSVIQGLANEEYGSQNTDGSRSIRRFYSILREMGASARGMLEQAAAQLWQVPLASVYAKDSFIHHSDSQRKVSFGYLAQTAARLTPSAKKDLTFKSPKDFKLIGKPIAGVDLAEMVSGKAKFGQDIKLEGMLYASIERSPVVGARVKSFDAAAAENTSGVVATYQMPTQPSPVVFHPLNGVAVLASNTWSAMQGRQALNIQWELGDNAKHNSEIFLAELKSNIVSKGKTIRHSGDAYHSMAQAASSHSATYSMPYLVHAPMEPPAATASFTHDQCEIWACTQTPQSTQANVAEALGIEKSKVKVNVTFLGGGFGRKSKPDFSVEAALLSKQMGKPVKVVWSREDDIQHGYYHAISAQHFQAGFDQDKQLISWVQRTAFPSISWTFNATTDEADTGELSLGFGDMPFAVKDLSCETHKATGHIRIGWMRSVSNIHHAFAQGSFVDELAVETGQTTRKMWHQLLGTNRLVDPKTQGFDYQNYGEPLDVFPIDIGRIKRVLDLVVEKSAAEQPCAENEAWGISAQRSFVSYVAVATKVRVINNTVKVLEMHSAIDAGTVVNPDRVRSQQEGSMIFGLSLALLGEISIKDGAVEQSNYHDYQVLRMHQCPKIETYIIESDAPPGGVGEPGTPPVAASLANAIFHASGKRIRDLPVSKHLSV
ncbi:molybdopterin cofactor-binding domain-containing protein [Aliiglaciecola sp. LCG003]|uniref:xanthine dehydrogenase family protein molybdopterin-binding subunit n=1 Tax=Aliiglaciecola sp. LCG003 TaxID=3053655 RepID=UPI002573C5D4|nr:molybdopterin cofactor-binding domain-containing protein [Aliiglaciecola sp. LCG003]WJG07761.1 molybdopterin-dependent oxidoreductase [Aliiglaciecola sp. LCG003]